MTAYLLSVALYSFVLLHGLPRADLAVLRKFLTAFDNSSRESHNSGKNNDFSISESELS